MGEELSTDVSATPAADSDMLTSTPSGDLGEVVDSATALGTASASPEALETWETGLPEVDQVIQSIPEDDSDLEGHYEQRHVQGLIQARGQLRVLNKALRDSYQQQKVFSELGDPESIQAQLELANLLFSPVTDPRTGQPIYDPGTQTAYVSTKPFIGYLDEYSPGMPEQLLADLLEYQTEVQPGVRDTLANQVFRHWGLDPTRLKDYQNIDTLAPSSSVPLEELSLIPSQFHEAYRSIPPSIRLAWETYEPGDQMRMLHDYQGRLDDQAYKQQLQQRDAQLKAQEDARFRALVSQEQGRYFDTVRRERFGAIATSLKSQVKFSDDPSTNAVMHGVVGATLANLIDPELRFVSEGTLKALGITLDHTFDEVLNKFNSNASDRVALEMAGDTVRAGKAQNDAKAAADQIVAKLTTIALKLAAKIGGQIQTVAAGRGNALASATAVRPTSGNGAAPTQGTSILPQGVMPGSPEATAFWAANFPGV